MKKLHRGAAALQYTLWQLKDVAALPELYSIELLNIVGLVALL